MTKSSKTILIYSDIHVGSKVSVCSESPEIIDSENYTPNKAQKALFQVWKEVNQEIQTKPDVVVINGEPIDGANPKSMGSGVWSTNLVDQIRDFKQIMKYVPTSKKMIFVRGSGYHVNTGGATNLEEIVAEEMKADRYRAYGGSGFTDYEANLELNGKYFNFTHHIGFAQWEAYRTTALARELVKMHFEHERRGHHTDVIVRSHVHYYVQVRFKSIVLKIIFPFVILFIWFWKVLNLWIYIRNWKCHLSSKSCCSVLELFLLVNLTYSCIKLACAYSNRYLQRKTSLNEWSLFLFLHLKHNASFSGLANKPHHSCYLTFTFVRIINFALFG